MNHNQNIINPKPCSYNCGTRIYWSVADNAYFEVFTKQKHICKNRSSTNQKSTNYNSFINNKPNYYNNNVRKSSSYIKPKMSNSLELLSGPISEIQKKYEILSDIVTEYNGKVHVRNLMLMEIIYL
jgi:hypothetical protein